MEGQRRYDIDWLRVISIGLLLIYHVVIGFQPWGVFIQFIQSTDSLEILWTLMSMVNVWRIPLLFFVSGMGVYFAMKKRDWKGLLKERSQRILIPFLVGTLAIVPWHVYLWSDYYNQNYQFIFNPSHLWFLGNIFTYVLISFPLLFLINRKKESIQKTIKTLVDHPLKLMLLSIPLVVEVILVSPDSYETYAMTWHGYFLGFSSFILGFVIMLSGDTFWTSVKRGMYGYGVLAFALYLLRVLVYNDSYPMYLIPFETIAWILLVFGFGKQYLNKPSKALSYLSEAAYPVYIVHMFWIYVASYFFFPLEMNAWQQFGIVTAITFIGSLASYHAIIRPAAVLRPLFGLKVKQQRKTIHQTLMQNKS
jgi:glucan biosynthesis protein C